jgi:undecaprenyl-diphosphatase
MVSAFSGPARQIDLVNYGLFELVNGLAGRADGLGALSTLAVLAVFAGRRNGVRGDRADLPDLRRLRGARRSGPVRRRVRSVLELGVALVLAFAAATVVSHVSDQLRPFQTHQVHQLISHDPGVSLPSDHATAAFALAFGIYAFLSHRWGIVLGFGALAVGFSRIWVGRRHTGRSEWAA